MTVFRGSSWAISGAASGAVSSASTLAWPRSRFPLPAGRTRSTVTLPIGQAVLLILKANDDPQYPLMVALAAEPLESGEETE